MGFAEVVRRGRYRLGWSQETLAQTLGVTQRYVSAVENGEGDNPTLETIRQFMNALQLQPKDLELLFEHQPALLEANGDG
jgi:transcriptional regulator with XRE-family HTH domain